MKGHVLKCTAQLAFLAASVSTAAVAMTIAPAAANAGPGAAVGVPYASRTEAVLESQAAIFDAHRKHFRVHVTHQMHSSQYDSRHRDVKIIWWNPLKSPTDITPTDLINGGKAFDGFIIQHLLGTKDDPKRNEQFAWSAFSVHHYSLDGSDDDIGRFLTALKNLPPDPMPERFIRVNIDSSVAYGFNWLDDNWWDNVASNMKVASQMCHDANLRGIFLDTEGYNGVWFSYINLKKDPKYAGMSFEDMSAIAENRGRQVMRALNSEDPSITIYVSTSSIAVSSHVNRGALSVTGSLTIPFLDGMLDASTRSTTFIDGAELSYWHDDTPNYFDNWRHAILDPSRYNYKFQKYPDKFQRQYEVGFALFLDRDRAISGQHGVYGWCDNDKPQLFYSPARLAFTVQQAVKASDHYIWLYTQRVDGWAAPGSSNTAIPQSLVDAIRDGQRHGNDPSLPALSQNNSPVDKADACGGK